MKRARARMRRVGKESYQVSSQRQVALSREAMLDGATVEELLVEKPGTAKLLKGDVVLRKVEVFTTPAPV